MWTVLILAMLAVVLALVIKNNRDVARQEEEKRAAMSPQQLSDYLKNKKDIAEIGRRTREERNHEALNTLTYGALNSAMICPHCTIKGHIRTQVVQNKRGVSGGKATAAILTGGISMLATGLSRKEQATQAWCGNCRHAWSF